MNTIKVNPSDLTSLINLMDTYGNSETSFFGETEDEEVCLISISKDIIVVQVFQDNDWTRTVSCYRDGTSEVVYTPPEI